MSSKQKTSKNRRTLMIFIGGSFLLHVALLIIIGGMTIYQISQQQEAEFEAPPEVALEPQEVKISLTKDMQKASMPRQVITVQNINMAQAMSLDLPQVSASSRVGFSGSAYGKGLNLTVASMPSIDFFGLTTEANSMVFVVDISGSMLHEPRGKDGFKKVADEILRVLNSINDSGQSVKFNIVCFAGEVDRFQGSLASVNDDTIRRAESYLRRMDPAKALKGSEKPDWKKYKDGLHYGTRVDLALEDAFEIDAESIFLLSDGEPSTKSAKEVLEMAKQLQAKKEKPIPITTISYKSKDGRSFLQNLAKQNSGQYQTVN